MLIYVLIIVLFFLSAIELKLNKRIFSPTFLFNFIWFITLLLYQFKLSYIQQDLSIRTTLCFYICVISYNLIINILNFIKLKEIKLNLNNRFNIEEKIKFCNIIILFVLIVEIIYSKGFPLYWKLFGIRKSYLNFGIPSLHGAFCGLVICLGAYSLFKKKRVSILYFLIGIILISRQILISIVVEWIIMFFVNKNILKSLKKLIPIAIICILCFNIIGNFRSGNTVMQDVFQAKKEYKNLPSSAKWIYSYMTFSISNFNKLVHKTDGGVNKGASTLSEFLPNLVLDKINIKKEFNKKFLVSRNYTVSTYLPSLYLDFGFYGIAVFNMLIAAFGYILYNNLNINKSTKNLLLYSIFGHNIIFLFFNNMFLYLPIIIQFAYIMIIFNDIEEKEEVLEKNPLNNINIKTNLTDLVSIIVPIYNVEKYIDRCIKSIISQTYKNIEIILVNDGSTDNSGKICDEYAKKDKRIKAYHKKNGGLSDARNFGISKANGQFYCFIDSDDYINENMVLDLLNVSVNHNVKIAWCDKIMVLESGKQFCQKIYDHEYKMTKEEAFKNVLLNDPSVCDKMFKSTLFKNVSFPKGKLFEDIITINKLFEQCDYVYHVGSAYYYYYQRSGSIVHSKFNIKKMDYAYNAKKLYNYIIEKYPSLEEVANSYYILTLSTLICDAYIEKEEYKKEYNWLLNELLKFKYSIINNKQISITKRIMAIIILNKGIPVVLFVKKLKNLFKYK